MVSSDKSSTRIRLTSASRSCRLTRMEYKIAESTRSKHMRSPKYNYDFCKETGYFARWGETVDDDPDWSPAGCEILDVEVSTICSQGCRFCYKSNTGRGHNMSLETFTSMLAKMPPTLTQLALGIGDLDANPDLWGIMQHCRDQGVIPNITINGSRATADHYDQLASLCGAVAVSRYSPDVCYDAVEQLSSRGLEQVNIHQLLSEETFQDCLDTIRAAAPGPDQDPRLKGLRAIVFLALKPTGRGTSMTPLRSVEQYRELVNTALAAGVGFGFDSCSAPMFLAAIEGHERYDQFLQLAEPCESTLFSLYVDTFATAHPCSFLENAGLGVDVLQADDFVRDVWHAPKLVKWRVGLLATAAGGLVEGCRQCPAYPIYPATA